MCAITSVSNIGEKEGTLLIDAKLLINNINKIVRKRKIIERIICFF
jgi:hypothetical protein